MTILGENLAPVRVNRRYSIHVMVFPAEDEEAAFVKAVEEAKGDSDVHFDGPGERDLLYTLGLHELEEYPVAENFIPDLHARGVWVASVQVDDVDGEKIPRVREKEELNVFRIKRLYNA